MNINSKVKLHHLKASSEPDENNLYSLVRWDTDQSILVPTEAIKIIKNLSENKSIKETAHELKLNSSEIIDLINQLIDVDYVAEIDGKKLKDDSPKIKPLLVGVNRKIFRFFLLKPVLYLLFSFTVSGLFIGFTHPTFYPSYKQFFWTNDLFVVFLSLFLISSFFLFIHETGHFIATKAVGGEATMRLSNRYLSLVAETESYHLAVVPKVLRYFVYFNGMFVDFFIIAGLYWLLFIISKFNFSFIILEKLIFAVILLLINAIIWQYNVFLETDMYNFLSDYLGEENLKINAEKFLGLKIKKWQKPSLKGPKQMLLKLFMNKNVEQEGEDFRFVSKTEKKHFLIYSLILTSGIIFMTLNYAFFIIPREIVFFASSFQNIILALKKTDFIELIKNIILLFLISFQYILLMVIHFRKKYVKQ